VSEMVVSYEYRVIQSHGDRERELLRIYYVTSVDGVPESWDCVFPPDDSKLSLEELKQHLQAMLEALNKPILVVQEARQTLVEKGR